MYIYLKSSSQIFAGKDIINLQCGWEHFCKNTIHH